MYDHVILISLDTWRSDLFAASPAVGIEQTFGVAGDLSAQNIDRLLSEGAYFPNTLSAAPYTSSSHASYFTGRWPLRHGLYEFFSNRLDVPTIFTEAKAKGYRTNFKTDFPVILGEYLGFTRDIDSYRIEDDEGFLSDVMEAQKSLSFCHFSGGHLPYGFHKLVFGGDAYREKVAELEHEIGGFDVLPQDQLFETYMKAEDRDLLLKYKVATEHLYRQRRYDRLMSLYCEGAKRFLQTRLEPFLERLLEATAERNALVVLFGDHGEEYDAESRGHYDSVNDGVIRVPMVFFGNGIVARRHDEVVRSIDLVPTLLELLGWSSFGPVDGESLGSALSGDKLANDAVGFAQCYVADTASFVEVQRHVLKGDTRPRPLRHVLYKEAIWRDHERLSRQLHAYHNRLEFSGLHAIEPELLYESRGNAISSSTAEAQDLLRTLLSYCRMRRHDAQPHQVPDALYDSLRASGYHI